MEKIIIHVLGGVATVVDNPTKHEVDIIDFDVDCCDDSELCFCQLGQGDRHEHRS